MVSLEVHGHTHTHVRTHTTLFNIYNQRKGQEQRNRRATAALINNQDALLSSWSWADFRSRTHGPEGWPWNTVGSISIVLIPLVFLHCSRTKGNIQAFQEVWDPGSEQTLQLHHGHLHWRGSHTPVWRQQSQKSLGLTPPISKKAGLDNKRDQGPAMPRRPSTIASLPQEKDQGNPTGVLLQHAAMVSRGECAAPAERHFSQVRKCNQSTRYIRSKNSKLGKMRWQRNTFQEEKNKTPEELSDVEIGNISDRVQGNDHNNQTVWEKTGWTEGESSF